jgi:hypothetical protein
MITGDKAGLLARASEDASTGSSLLDREWSEEGGDALSIFIFR